MRHRGLRWQQRYGHLDDDAIHILDSAEHAGGWSGDALVTIPGWDRHGRKRLARDCVRPPLSQERLGRLARNTLVYNLRRPTVDGRSELVLTPLELIDKLAPLVTPPCLHKHCYFGVLASNAALREVVTASAGPAGVDAAVAGAGAREHGIAVVTGAAVVAVNRPPCFSPLLLVRIYECLALRCPKCGEPMRIIAFELDQPTIERILAHIGEPTQPPVVLPARSPPQGALPSAGQRGGWDRMRAVG